MCYEVQGAISDVIVPYLYGVWYVEMSLRQGPIGGWLQYIDNDREDEPVH